LLNSLPRLDRPQTHLQVLERDDAWRETESVSGVK